MNKTQSSGVRDIMLKYFDKPVLVAGGCSFTDPKFRSVYHPEMDVSFAKWPELVGKQLGYKVINTGTSGAGNKLIADRVMDAVLTNKNVKIVMVLWSGFDRFSVYNKINCPFPVIRHIFYEEPGAHDNSKQFLQTFYKKAIDDWFSLEENIRYNLRIIYQLQEFLKNKSIKYIFAQGTDPYSMGGMFELYDLQFFRNPIFNKRNRFKIVSMMDDMYFDLIDESHFYGWPGLEELGGTNFSKYIRQKDNYDDYHLSRVDRHPNALGHQNLSEMFLKTYGDVYEKV